MVKSHHDVQICAVRPTLMVLQKQKQNFSFAFAFAFEKRRPQQ
jgi:hypothetical protein